MSTATGRPPLWPHQERGINETIELFESGVDRVCITGPTGSGKSLEAVVLMEWALSRGLKSIFYTNRRLLLEQMAQVFTKSGLDFGVRAAGFDDLFNPHQPIQLASTQTEHHRAYQRSTWKPFAADLVLFDEPHLQKGKMSRDIIQYHTDEHSSRLVGFTATPLGISDVYERLVVAGTVRECRKTGSLLPCHVYGPSEIDTRYIQRVGDDGEFAYKDVKKIWTTQIFAHVVKSWRELNPEQKPTILFAPGVAESVWFAQQFEAIGVKAAHIDGADIYVDGERRKTEREERAAVIERVRNNEIKVLCNRFVCLDDKTEILTSTGWVGISDITPICNVANWDEGRVTFSAPVRVIQRWREPGERMVVLETPRRSIRVTESHELLYRTTRDGTFVKSQARTLVDKAVKLPVSGMCLPQEIQIVQPEPCANRNRRIIANSFLLRQKGYDKETARIEAARRIDERNVLQYRQSVELTEHECEFIGLWVGDGNKNKLAKGGVEYRLYQGLDCPTIVDRVRYLIERLGVDSIEREVSTENGVSYIQWSFPRGTGFGPQRRSGLFHLEPYLKKSGSQCLWGLDTVQFNAFLKGLWMANGMPHNDNTELPGKGFKICSANERLFDLLQGIAVCRGYRASVRRYKQWRSEHNIYLLTLTETDCHAMTKYRLQFEDGWKDEPVWCVETESGNIITRRNGSVTVMGNCREGLDVPEIAHCVLATPIGSLVSYLQTVGRVLRNHPSLDHVVLQDHGGNWHRHGSPNIDRDWLSVWTMPARVITDLRLERMRERTVDDAGYLVEPEPICCPRCGMARTSGIKCANPACGYVSPLKVRHVLQADGKLVDLTGDIFRPRRTARKHDTEYKWEQCYFRCRAKSMTFRQAYGLFYYENRYFPPRDLPRMPINDLDWFRKVDRVGEESLL